jgi:hypothetical protein
LLAYPQRLPKWQLASVTSERIDNRMNFRKKARIVVSSNLEATDANQNSEEVVSKQPVARKRAK